MIDMVSRIKVTPGRVSSHAVKWANKIIEYSKKSGLGGHLFLLRPATGERNEIAFVDRCSSMAEWEERLAKRQADSGWMEIVKELLEADWYLGATRQIYDVLEVVE